jgi:hypothetical protein
LADHISLREQLDRTLWSAEVEAQRHEEVFVALWDALRGLDDAYATLRAVKFEQLTYGAPRLATQHGLDIDEYQLADTPQTLDQDEWTALLTQLETEGYRIAQTEWHHSRFVPAAADRSAESTVSFAIDLERAEPVRRASLRGYLDIRWAKVAGPGSRPQIASLRVRDGLLLVRDAAPAFREILRARSDSQFPRVMPLLLSDLDGNGGSEVILGGLNRIYRNDGRGTLTAEPLTSPAFDMFDAAIIADFNHDGHNDLLCVSNERYPVLLAGDSVGRFTTPPHKCADVVLDLPKAFTAGDIDADGDLDVWIGQYKFPYEQGSMPTPFYDSNDGFPAVLLENDGHGAFRDVTVAAGLDRHRNRRTYSASLVDLDNDHDLDLMTVNDFCGIDVYENNGHGQFQEVTDRWISDRHLFGMGHTLADFDQDGLLDMYLIGMSSTTARRLDQLKLGRDDHSDINEKRRLMGYGNRLLLQRATSGGVRYEQANWNDGVARTGWSWGTSSPDIDNDGDPDIYVANGHTSGQSAKDYCTRYWCHDVYTGNSSANPELAQLFDKSLNDFRRGEISWNGFEHNVLWLNEGHGKFVNVAFLLGVGFEFDSRAVACDDLDNDGRRDLLVVRFRQQRKGQAEYELHVLRNELPTNHHWLGVRLETATTGRSPLGAQVTVTSGAGTKLMQRVVTGDSFSAQHAPTLHFGLGTESTVRQVDIRWQDGTERQLINPAVDQYHVP